MRENKARGGVKPKISKSAQYWLDVREFDTPAECAEELKREGYQIWVTDLAPDAEMLASPAEYSHYMAMREKAAEAYPENDETGAGGDGAHADSPSAPAHGADASGASSAEQPAKGGGGPASSDASSSSSGGSSSVSGLPPARGTGAAAAQAMQHAARAVGELPARVAIVMGRESDGVSEAMKQLADKKVFLPMWGFTESLNLSVATALVLDRLMGMLGPGRFGLPAELHRDARRSWLPCIAKSPAMLPVYAAVIAKEEEEPGYIRPIGELRRFATSRQK